MNIQYIIAGSVLLCSAAASAVPTLLPTKEEAQKTIYQFAETYVCPNNQLTLMESLERKLPCPKGQNAIPMIYKSLLSGEWDAEEAMSLATGEFKVFQPQNIEQLVNIGNPEASVVVIEYTDPQCPFCSYFMSNQFPQIKKRFIDTGKVQYRYHHTPLEYHKDAFLASEANYCAADQDAYYSYHKILLSDTQKQSKSDLVKYARQTNLNINEFTDCLDSHKYRDKVSEEKAIIDKVTPITYPFFVIGHYESGEFKAQSVYGAPWLHIQNVDKLASVIEKELANN